MPDTVLSGFSPGDAVDLAGVSYSSSATYQLLSGNQLQLTENGNSYVLNLDPTQSYSSFHVFPDTAGGTEIQPVLGSSQPSLTIVPQWDSTYRNAARSLCDQRSASCKRRPHWRRVL
jgi:hypothetical protein